MNLEFTIEGNPDDPTGNAVPKLKMTGKQHWTKKAQRYVAWKEHVCSAFFQGLKNMQSEERAEMEEFVDYLTHVKPLFTGTKKVHMDLMIYWKNGRHGDPENIFGSIADAIFDQDKYLAGSFDFEEKPVGAGRVDVKITV